MMFVNSVVALNVIFNLLIPQYNESDYKMLIRNLYSFHNKGWISSSNSVTRDVVKITIFNSFIIKYGWPVKEIQLPNFGPQ